jgi:copper chaperone CopZ
MRQLFLAMVATVALAGLCVGRAPAGQVEVKGVHICCPACANAVKAALGKVDGVSDVNAEKGKPVTFTAKDDKAAEAGVKALLDKGFFGTATVDDKELKVETDAPKKGDKADEITITGVHICCPGCANAAKTVLSKVEGVSSVDAAKGKPVTVKGKDVDKSTVLEALHKGGFNGKIEK